MSPFRTLRIVILSLLLFTPTPGNGMDDLDKPNEEPVSKFVLHNMYGSVFLNKLCDDGKDMRVQFTFRFLKYRIFGAKTNIITLAPGEKRTFVISDLKLWDFNDENEGEPVQFTDINPYDLGILVSWPRTGSNFHNEPQQPFGSPPQPHYPWREREVKEKKLSYMIDSYQSSADRFDLRKGQYLKIIRGDVYMDNTHDPCAEVRQKKTEEQE